MSMHAISFITFFRSLKRHKVFTVINLTGLVLGFTSLLLIGVWILDELNYDRDFSFSNRLYRVEQQVHTPDGVFHVAITPTPLASVLKENYPEIQETARISYMGDYTFAYEDKQFIENRIMAADPSFLKLFDFNAISGAVPTAFEDVNSVILTDKIAKKYFGDTYPVGKSQPEQHPSGF